MLSAALVFGSCSKQDKDIANNPLVKEWKTPFGTTPFEEIKPTDYLPAFKHAMKIHKEEVKAIIDNKETPNFQNTIPLSTLVENYCIRLLEYSLI